MVQRCLTTCLFLTVSHGVMAHSAVENTLAIRTENFRLVMDVAVTLEEILVAQGVKAGPDGGFDQAALQDAAQRHRGYLASHLFVEAARERLPLQVTKFVPPARFATPHTTTYHYEIVCPGRSVPEVTLRHDMLREYTSAPGVPWQVSYALQVQAVNSQTRMIDMLRRDRPITLKTGWHVAASDAPNASAAQPAKPRELPPWALASLAVGLTTVGVAWRWTRRRVACTRNLAA
jgi:hypothetical protein